MWMEESGEMKEHKKRREPGREVERLVKKREKEEGGNRMEGIWKGRQKEKEVEIEGKRMEEGI